MRHYITFSVAILLLVFLSTVDAMMTPGPFDDPDNTMKTANMQIDLIKKTINMCKKRTQIAEVKSWDYDMKWCLERAANIFENNLFFIYKNQDKIE